jgi:hypothetical protein
MKVLSSVRLDTLPVRLLALGYLVFTFHFSLLISKT